MLVPTQAGVNLLVDYFPEFLKGIKDLGEIMAGDKVIAKIRKNDNQQVWIGINTYKDIPLIYVRTFMKNKGGDK